VIAGGDDVAKATSTGKPYGVFSHPVKSWFGRYIFKHADLIIAISEYNYKEIVENTPASPKKIKIITHGFDGDIFKWDAEVQKENIVLTVGTVDNENYWRKGFYLIKETARLIPEASFYIVGPQKGMATRWLEKDRPRNLFIPGALYGKDLVDILGRTKVYLQVSEWESFGCALAEAMLCECVSVVFNCTALPEVVGDCGYYIEKLESNELAVKIRMALGDNKTGQKARQRIIREFPLLRRKDALIEAVGQLCDTAKKGH
jgi:glycosyltransferase involved in cell wall biosynthesis